MHSPHGVDDIPTSQFKHFASILAIVVFPTPRVPLNK